MHIYTADTYNILILLLDYPTETIKNPTKIKKTPFKSNVYFILKILLLPSLPGTAFLLMSCKQLIDIYRSEPPRLGLQALCKPRICCSHRGFSPGNPVVAVPWTGGAVLSVQVLRNQRRRRWYSRFRPFSVPGWSRRRSVLRLREQAPWDVECLMWQASTTTFPCIGP